MLKVIFKGFLYNKTIMWVLTVTAIIFNLLFGWAMDSWVPPLFLTLLFGGIICFVLGIFFSIKEMSNRKKYEKYQEIFNDINLISASGDLPYYLGADENEYLKLLTFQSLIPIENWEKKKAYLERYFNARILKICNAKDNNNIVNVYIVKKELPEMVEWDDDNILIEDYLSLGIDFTDIVYIDLNKYPHTFIAGETGAGKSVLIKCLIYQCLIKGYDVRLIDFKRGVSFAIFDKFVEIYSDYEKVIIVLESLVNETNDRLDLLRENKVENIKEYNQLSNRHMSRIIVFIDELAELIRSGDKEANKRIIGALETISRLSRAVGIHLFLGMQRVDSTIVNGQIKNNVSLRICGRFADPEPSRILLGNNLATDLPNVKGRMILKDDETREFQAFYVSQKSLNLERFKKDKTYSQPIDVTKTEEHREPKSIDFNFDDII